MDLRSNEPFWLQKNGIVNSYPTLKESSECDVLIVGGGITGSLLAHQMVKDGYSTVLIDKREVVHGSSSVTTSLIQYEVDVPLYKLSRQIGKKAALASYSACANAIETLEGLCKAIHSKAGFRKKKSLYFAADNKAISGLKQEFEAREKAGFKVKWLDSSTIEKRFSLRETCGGILSSEAASVDAYLLAHELLIYNTKRGLRVFDRTELQSVKYFKNHVVASCTRDIKIKARRIIYCIGYEAKDLIKEPFVSLKSTYAMASEIDREHLKPLSTTVFWNTADPYLYFRTTTDGRLIIGGADEEFSDPQKRDSKLDQKEAELKSQLSKLWPEYKFYTDFVWAGTFGETVDGLPYIGAHKEFPHSYFVLGFGGNGITFSVAGMEMASYFMKNKDHELSPYFKFGR